MATAQQTVDGRVITLELTEDDIGAKIQVLPTPDGPILFSSLWTPERIGGTRLTFSGPGSDEAIGWKIERTVTEPEKAMIKAYVEARKSCIVLTTGYTAVNHDGKCGSLASTSLHHKPSLDHLAPDHPWRTGVVPQPTQ